MQCSGAGSGAVHYGVSVLPLLVTDLLVQYCLAGAVLLCYESLQKYRHSTNVWRISMSGDSSGAKKCTVVYGYFPSW